MRARELPTGIFRTASGYRVVKRVHHGAGGLKTRRFRRDATLQEMKAWRDDQKQQWRALPPAPPEPAAPPTPATFRDDAATYLKAVAAMPSFKERKRDIGYWIDIFGDTPRAQITSAQIQTARDAWLTVGPKRVLVKPSNGVAYWAERAVPLSASTINHRLRALENLFTVLDGRHAKNPVRDVDECAEPDPQPRGQSFTVALEVMSYMPDITAPKKGGTHEPGSLSRARFEVMLWTGLPAVQIARLLPEQIDWKTRTMKIPRRLKGRRARRAGHRRAPVARPLLRQAIAALQRLFALGGNRKFSSTSLERSVRRAVAAANVERARRKQSPIPANVTVYDLTRHTFGTEAFRATGNLSVVQGLMDHRDIRQTERYAMAAIDELRRSSMRQLGARATRARRAG